MRVARWLDTLPLKLRSLFRRDQLDVELDEELRYHIERQVEQNVAAGMSAAEARTAALRIFGGVEFHKDRARDARGLNLADNLGRDLGHALRLIRRNPGFAMVTIGSLAVGLGATTSSFNLTWNLLFERLAAPHPEQLIALERVRKDDRDNAFSWAEVRALRETPGVGTLAAVRTASVIPISVGDHREFISMHFVEGAYFPMLGLQGIRGRLITPEDDARIAPVVVLSERFAARIFPGDRAPVGRTLDIRGTTFTVVGITPRTFRGLEYPGFFRAAIPLSTLTLIGAGRPGTDDRGVPFGGTDDRLTDQRAFKIVGRLAASPETARAALGLTFQHCCAVAAGREPEQLVMLDIRRGIAGGKNDFRPRLGAILMALLTGMGLVLVVVCCNIASLLMVRASARQREIAVRLSLGASRARLVSQLIVENVPLALAGGALGLVLAAWSTAALVRGIGEFWHDAPDIVAGIFQFGSAPAVFAFAAAVTLVCWLAFAIYPAFRATRQQVALALRVDGHASRSRAQGTVARGAVVAQVAVTIVLVTAASLLATSLRNLSRVDGGFATDRILLASIETRGTPYEQEGLTPRHAEMLRQIREIPGVRAAAMATLVPMFGGLNTSVLFSVPGHVAPADEPRGVDLDAVTPGFFDASGIRIVAGREFAPSDGAGAEPVVVVNGAFARRYFADRNPVGRSFELAIRGERLSAVRIVGLAADARYTDLRSAPEPFVYLPIAQTAGSWRSLQVLISTTGDPSSLATTVSRAVEAVAPGIQVRRSSDMRSERDGVMMIERLAARIATFMSVMGLVLSAVGLYGVVAYSVARRTSELGIRIALGASGRAIVWLVQREIVAYVAIGITIGVPLSFAANSALRSQLFGVGAHDPFLSIASVLLLAAVALVAGAVPARRAARIHPRIALSAE